MDKVDVLAVMGDDELLVHLSAGDHACEADQIAHYRVVSEVRKPSINGFRERRVWVMHSDFYAITDGVDWWSRQPYPAGDLRGSDSEEFSTRKEARAALARVKAG